MNIDRCELRLAVRLECGSLRNMDYIGKSDPFAILYLDSLTPQATPTPPAALAAGAPRAAPWQRVGGTETVRNSLDAVFAKCFEIPYFFERCQRFAIDVYDRDGPSDVLSAHDYLGGAVCTVPSAVRAVGGRLKIPLKGCPHGDRGFVVVIVEECSAEKEILGFDVGVRDLRKGWVLGEGPFLNVWRGASAGAVGGAGGAGGRGGILVYRSGAAVAVTGVGRNAFDFARVEHSYDKLCRGDDHAVLLFEITYSRGGRHKVVGTVRASLQQLAEAGGTVPLTAPTANKEVGKLVLKNRTMRQETSFLDYVMGGCEISLVVGIDFTASNGDPAQPGTLHFFDQYQANEYEMAIRSVGDILAEYDSDQKFPAYGFGAKLPPDFRKPYHKFSLTGNPDPTCYTIDGLLEAYRQTLYNVRPSGPTVFAELIRAAAEHASTEVTQSSQSYTILLIVTDGVINDMAATRNAIIHASSLPLSIVIIGVGNADFTDMDELDGDENPLAPRDIVQFVEFRAYRQHPEILAAKVLEEIPHQFVEFMKLHKITPGVPRTKRPNL